MKTFQCILCALFMCSVPLVGCPSSTTPTITGFAINNDAASTTSLSVTLNNTCTGNPVYYMASESASFTGATWQPYSTAPTFLFTAAKGAKTVYFKVKNDSTESRTICDSISMNEYTVTEETILLPNDVPMVMVWCPAGTFMMGRMADEENSAPYELPQHQVTLSKGFWMSKYEITKAQWTAVMETTPWPTSGSLSLSPDSPVQNISWNDAQSFMTALNTDTGLTFSLPTEAQWEYACRAETTTRFYWGNDADYSSIGSYAWYEGNTGDVYTHPVGQKSPNEFGLYDMSGNVWEFCQDYFGYYSSDPVTDPTGSATSTDTTHRIARGGCGYFTAAACSSAFRGIIDPSTKSTDFGIRVVRNE